MTATDKQTPSSHQLQVFYDGSCPICTREIAFYQRREGADGICWVDVSASKSPEVAPGLSKDQALSRFHVKTVDGTLVSGGAAFAELWTALPGFGPLGRIFQTSFLVWGLNRAYDAFLKLRPFLQRLAARG
jgi:predicted DCC family thiol-disulfide oxidoreductase YuxK